MERLERAGVQGECGPKLNAKKPMEYWVELAKKEGNLAPQPKLANEKPQGETIDYDTRASAVRDRASSCVWRISELVIPGLVPGRSITDSESRSRWPGQARP